MAASKPTSPLSTAWSPFDFVVLSRHLRALTRVWVFPLSERELTPRPSLRPSTAAVASEFERVPGALHPLHTQSVTLHHRLPPVGLSYDSFRGEPAITGLDWSFAPTPRLSQRFACQHGCGPPPGINPASPYLGVDRPASGRRATTTGTFIPSPSPTLCWLRAFAFASASDLLSLASPWPCTPRLVFQNERYDPGPSPSYFPVAGGSFGRLHSFRAIPDCSPVASGSFHPPSGVLFSVRSPY